MIQNENESELIAPCGMYCGICASYLSLAGNIPKKKNVISHCTGCRPRNKQCAYLKKNCPNLAENLIRFCYECQKYPCERLQHLDQRYRSHYQHSPLDNLEILKSEGVSVFLAKIKEQYRCLKCGGTICVHNKKCYRCEIPS